jgi:hypothetical protein
MTCDIIDYTYGVGYWKTWSSNRHGLFRDAILDSFQRFAFKGLREAAAKLGSVYNCVPSEYRSEFYWFG